VEGWVEGDRENQLKWCGGSLCQTRSNDSLCLLEKSGIKWSTTLLISYVNNAIALGDTVFWVLTLKHKFHRRNFVGVGNAFVENAIPVTQ